MAQTYPLAEENLLAKFEHDRPPDGGVMGLIVPPGPQFWQRVWTAVKRFDVSRSFLAGTYLWTTATTGDPPRPKRASWGPAILRSTIYVFSENCRPSAAWCLFKMVLLFVISKYRDFYIGIRYLIICKILHFFGELLKLQVQV